MITLVYQMMDEKRHCSIRILRILAHTYALYLLFLETYPELVPLIEKNTELFMKDEKNRLKDAVPNLGSFLSNILVSFKANHKDVFTAYIDEQMDRQVFWMLRRIPELEEATMQEHLDENRAKICFAHETTSYHIALFFKMLSDFVRNNFKDTKDLLNHFAKNFGKFEGKLENELQDRVFKISKVDNYDSYFEYLGLGKLDSSALNARLRQCVKNSRRKKYHGTDEEILVLPSSEEQIHQLTENQPKFEDFYDKEKKAMKDLPEDQWKKACIDRWVWIKDTVENAVSIAPKKIAVMSDVRIQSTEFKVEEELATLKKQYLKNENQDNLAPVLIEKYSGAYTWRELFVKLDLEEHLVFMDQSPDFQLYYDKLKAIQGLIKVLVIPLIDTKHIKSGHYYLTALLTHLTKLQHVEIIGLNQVVNLAALKSLAKGFHNFIEKGGHLIELSYGKFQVTTSENRNEISEKLFFPFQGQDLMKLAITGNNMMSFNGGKALSKVIIDHKIIELNLSKSGLTKELAKDLADGLMRAKQLQKVDISNNASISHTGLASIIYNLAFSPKLLSLNISQHSISAGLNEIVESLYKLLRISASLEILLINNFTGLNSYLSKDFCVALGEIRTLHTLNIARSGKISNPIAENLGKAIGFNARKKGSLQSVDMNEVIANVSNLMTMYKAMFISEHDHESWYGDANKLSKMQGKDFEKIYYNNLKDLRLNSCTIPTSFNYATWKKQFDPEDPDFVKLLARSQKLENVQLQQCNLNRQDADILLLALDPSRKDFSSKIKVLNLARNRLGKEGIKALAPIFEVNSIVEALDVSGNQFGVAGGQALAKSLATNKSIKYLNMFGNTIDVDGARAFEKTLSTNTTLEFIDFGHNRFRDEGVSAIARGLNANANSAIKYLGLRFNFITEDGAISFLKKLFSSGKYAGKLQSLYIKNNNINEFGLFNVMKVVQNLNVKLHFDVFDKLKLLDSSILERTVWIHPARVGTPQAIKQFFETQHNCGIVLNVRRRKGPKWANRKQAPNEFYFVEFAHTISVTRALHVASRRQAHLGGISFRIYKAGSGNYFCNNFLLTQY